MTREDKVQEFRKAAGKLNFDEAPNESIAICDMIAEEYEEFIEAVEDYEIMPSEATRSQLVKEWADLQYVVSQAALYYNIPADPAFNRVHESNMTKVVEGKIIYRDDGKVLKPDTYEAPNMAGL